MDNLLFYLLPNLDPAHYTLLRLKESCIWILLKIFSAVRGIMKICCYSILSTIKICGGSIFMNFLDPPYTRMYFLNELWNIIYCMKTLIIPGTELCPMKWKKILFNIHDPHPPQLLFEFTEFYLHPRSIRSLV